MDNLNKSTMNKTKIIDDVAEIRFGYYAKPETSGEVVYKQLNQFNQQGLPTIFAKEFTKLNDKSKGHILRDGDVLFVGKGNRLFSWCYHDTGQPMVASSVFFVLTPDKSKVHPDYLAVILNAPQIKTNLRQIGAGTKIFSIRKSELAAVQIPLPPIRQQQRIATLAELHQREIELTQQMITQKQQLYTSIISKLIK